MEGTQFQSLQSQKTINTSIARAFEEAQFNSRKISTLVTASQHPSGLKWNPLSLSQTERDDGVKASNSTASTSELERTR